MIMNDNQIDAEKVRVEPVRAWATILKISKDIELSHLSHNKPHYVPSDRMECIEVLITPVNYVLQEPVGDDNMELEDLVAWNKGKVKDLTAELTSSKERIAYLEAENGRLRVGIERIGSMSAFGMPRVILNEYDDELIKRIEFARSLLSPQSESTKGDV